MDFEILSETNKDLFDKIFSKYKTEKESVIRYVRLNRPTNSVSKSFKDKDKLILVEELHTLIPINKGIRISKTTVQKIIVNRKEKQVWFITGKTIRQLHLATIQYHWKEKILKFMGNNFEWLDTYDVRHSLGYIWKRNYTNPTDYFKKENLVKTSYVWSTRESKDIYKVSKNWDFLKTNFNLLDNIPNLKDLVRFAYILDEKIDWNWSTNRFKQQHDEWAIIVQNLNILFQDELKVNPTFNQLENSDLVLLNNLEQLMTEGGRQHHCVGTYSSKINSGKTAIFVYKENWTCEISSDFKLIQMKGKFNSNPTEETKKELEIYLKKHKEIS